jgi:DNA repair exonuclease SbcCD ATPase subunit
MKEYFQEELKKVKRVEVEVSAYESQRLRFSEDLKELQADEEFDLEELEEQRTELKGKRKKLIAKVSKLTMSKTYLELQAQLTKSIGKAERPSKKRMAELKTKIAALEEQQELQATVKSQKKNLKQYKQQLDDIIEELNSIYQKLFKKDFDEPFDLDSSIESKYQKAKSENKLRNEIQEELNDLVAKLKNCKKTKKTEDELESLISECKQQIKTYNKLKEHLEEDTCPICGSVVDLNTIKKKAVTAKANIEGYKLELSYITTSKEIAKLKTKLEASSAVDITELKSQYDDYLIKRENYQRVQRLHGKQQTIQDQYDAAKKECISNSKKLDDSIDITELDALRDEAYNAKRLTNMFTQLDEVISKAEADGVDLSQNLNNVINNISKYEEQATKIESRIENISTKINRSNVQAEKSKLISTKLYEVNDKIEKLNSVLADKEILETLVKVYSSKGIKIQKINSICRLIEKNLNHFKSLLYGENFKFKIKITEKSFDVIVDRGDGVLSDVRLLSGSESRRFNLLLLISLLPLTPKSRRCNLVVLDEMESNGDPVTMKLFCERFIPELHKFIPNVIVVSPLPLEIPNAHKILVVKDDTGSRIEHVDRMVLDVKQPAKKKRSS